MLAQIIGRRAGKDIKDHQGKIMLRKGAIISPEIVAWAEDEGRTAELLLVASLGKAEDEVKQLRRKLQQLGESDLKSKDSGSKKRKGVKQ